MTVVAFGKEKGIVMERNGVQEDGSISSNGIMRYRDLDSVI
jgi:hypothetical protein